MQDQSLNLGGVSVLAEVFQDPAVAPKRANYEAGAAVFEPTDPAQSLFYVHRGQIRVYQLGGNDETRLIEILGPDDWFGTASLARIETYRTRAVAVTNSVVTEVRTQRLMDVMVHKPAALIELNRQLAGRLENEREEAANLIFKDCNNRLIETLLRFSQSAAASKNENGVVLRITHQQLAQAVGVARETVSLALTQLRQKNLLQTGRNQLTFNPEALKSFSRHLGKTEATPHTSAT